MYKCKGCGLVVVVIDGNIIKPCKCNDGVVAELNAGLKGLSYVNRDKTSNRR